MLNSPLSDFVRPALTLTGEESIRLAARHMTDASSRAALITGNDGHLRGIVTDQDLRSRVIADGLSPDDKVSSVMTQDPVVQTSGQKASDALLLMARRNIRHIPVSNSDGSYGVVAVFDLLRQYQYSAAYLVGDIHEAKDVDTLVSLSQHIPKTLAHMVHNGFSPNDIGEDISMIGQEIVNRLLTLAEQQYGPPPVPYCYVVAGSMGRHEQTAHTDQDTGMILSDEFDPELHDEYFLSIAKIVSDGMDACGYIYCPGDIMATNPKWRQPLAVWRNYFHQWIDTPEPKALLHSGVFFDLRCVYGDEDLFTKLREDLLARTQKNSLFQALMAGNAGAFKPPLGLFNRFIMERNEAGQKVVNMKLHGVVPVIDMARVYTLANGLPQVNTSERITAITESGVLSPPDASDLRDAFDFISEVRLEHQAKQIQQGKDADNYLVPSTLSPLERRHLKDAFDVVKTLQAAMLRHYRTS